MKNKTLSIVYTALISATYCALTVALYPISYGPIQFRISEVLCILALFMPQSIIGLSVGCFISNIFSSAGPLDMILGSTATFLAAFVTYLAGKNIKNTLLKLIIGVLAPTIFNALLVPIAILGFTQISQAYFVYALWVGLGELGVLTLFGIPFYFGFLPLYKRLLVKQK